jgi:DNA polymerase-3 subunit epsilon
VKHGALLDAELLAEVYVELIGARQAQLILSQAPAIIAPGEIIAVRERPAPLPSRLTADAQAAHRQFIVSLGENAVWRDYVSLD